MPRVSVLIPAFDAEKTILRALHAAQNQSMTDIEILVIDDASTDTTPQIVGELAKTDTRIRLIRQEANRGPAAARNRGIAAARGEWIALLDADDSIAPERLESLLAKAAVEDVLVADNLAMFDLHANKVVKLGIAAPLLGTGKRFNCKQYVAHCQTNQPEAVDFGLLKPLLRVSHLRQHGIYYDETIRYGEDFKFYLDVLLAGGVLHVLPEAYYLYTERTGSASGVTSEFSKTKARYDRLAADTRELAADPCYQSVIEELTLRADAIRRLAKVAIWGQRPRVSKWLTLAATLADHDLRHYLMSRLRVRKALLLSTRANSKLLKDASNLCLGQGIKLILQAIYFLLIARSLGPSQYGAFVAITAMTSIICPYVGLGCGSLFLKNVRSGKRKAELCWGNGLLLTVITGMAATGLLAGLARMWLPNFSTSLVWVICLSDLLLIRVVDLASFGFAASGKMSKTAVQNTLMSFLRVAGIVFLTVVNRQVSIEQWTWVYLGTGILGASFAFQQGNALWGAPKISFLSLIEDAREGCFFSISTSAQTIYNDIDKTMLARLSTLSATGVYAAAYRIIDTSLTPVRALVSAAYPEFFRVGLKGLDASYVYAKSLIRKAIVFGLVDFVGLMFFAPILPHILGPKYAAVAPAVRLLAIIPLMRCVHWFVADALSGANSQGLRTAVQVGVAVLNVGLNLVILPKYSWVGAAWTSVASDFVLMGTIYLVVLCRLPRKKVEELVHAFE